MAYFSYSGYQVLPCPGILNTDLVSNIEWNPFHFWTFADPFPLFGTSSFFFLFFFKFIFQDPTWKYPCVGLASWSSQLEWDGIPSLAFHLYSCYDLWLKSSPGTCLSLPFSYYTQDYLYLSPECLIASYQWKSTDFHVSESWIPVSALLLAFVLHSHCLQFPICTLRWLCVSESSYEDYMN